VLKIVPGRTGGPGKREGIMKKNILIATGCLLIFCLPASADTIKMGYFILKPHLYLAEDGTAAKGAAIEYFNDVAAKMGYAVEWTGPLPFLRLIKYLQDGTVDGAQMMAKNEERKKFLYYPDMPYSPVQSVLVLRKEHPLNKIESANDIKGFVIGYLSGANLSPFMKAHSDQVKIEYINSDTWFEQNLKKLIFNRIDAVYDQNAVTAEYEAKRLKADDKVRILPLPEPPNHIYTVFSKQSLKGKKLLEQYNSIFKSLDLKYEDYVKKELANIR